MSSNTIEKSSRGVGRCDSCLGPLSGLMTMVNSNDVESGGRGVGRDGSHVGHCVKCW